MFEQGLLCAHPCLAVRSPGVLSPMNPIPPPVRYPHSSPAAPAQSRAGRPGAARAGHRPPREQVFGRRHPREVKKRPLTLRSQNVKNIIHMLQDITSRAPVELTISQRKVSTFGRSRRVAAPLPQISGFGAHLEDPASPGWDTGKADGAESRSTPAHPGRRRVCRLRYSKSD